MKKAKTLDLISTILFSLITIVCIILAIVEENMDFIYVIYFVIFSILLLVITIIEFIMSRNNIEMNSKNNYIMSIILLVLSFFCFILGVPLAIIKLIYLCNFIKEHKADIVFDNLVSNDNKSINNLTIGNNSIKDHFGFKIRFNEAMIEYSKIFNKRISKLKSNDYVNIYEYSKMHFAYFLLWLIDRKIVNEEFIKEYGYEFITDIASHKISPVELLKNVNYSIFTSVELYKNSDNYFVSNYFASKDYLDEYFIEVSKFNNRLYCNDFSYEIYDCIAKMIDNRYYYYTMSRDSNLRNRYYEVHDNVRDKIFMPLFGQELEIVSNSEVTLEYYNSCIEHLNNLPEKLCNEIIESLHDYIREGDWDDENNFEGISDNTIIFKELFDSGRIFIDNPIEFVPAFSIVFDDGAEGFEYVIMGDYLIDYICTDEIHTSIWSSVNVYAYKAMKQIDNNEMTEVKLLKKDNSVFVGSVPNCVFAEIKDNERVLNIKKGLGIISNYYYDVNFFKNGELHYITLYGLKDNAMIIYSTMYQKYDHRPHI